MKIIFLSNHPHPVHGAWAESINAKFILDRVNYKIKIPFFSRIIKSIITFLKIPKDTYLILCESSSQLTTGILWKIFNKTKKIVAIISDPKVYYLKNNKGIKRRVYIQLLNKVDLFIPTSPLMSSFLPKEIKSKKIIVFPYVDLLRYSKYKSNLSNKLIISIGRISYDKGTDISLEIFKAINKKHKDSKILFLGMGKLKEELENKKIKNASFLGWVDKPEEYLQKGSIYLSSARIEPAGIAVLEAMTIGLVPIVSGGVGNKYIVERIDKSLVINNEEEAIEIIEKLWNNPKLLETYSQKAKKIAKEYNKKKSLKRFKKAMTYVGVKEIKINKDDINKERYVPTKDPYLFAK